MQIGKRDSGNAREFGPKAGKIRSGSSLLPALKQGFATRISCSYWLSLSQQEALDFEVPFSLSALATFPLVTVEPLPFLPSFSLTAMAQPPLLTGGINTYVYLHKIDPATILHWLKSGELSMG